MTKPIAVNHGEVVAFLGDSITQQNLYTALIETFLRSRVPEKELRFYNFGWGGDSAPGGAQRYARDVVPVKPDLVLVKFGMNDGAYTGPDAEIRERYLAGQRRLADAIAAGGARQVLISPNAVDPHPHLNHLQDYNATLALFAEHLKTLASERGIPFIDFFPPFLAIQHRAKAADPTFTMIPDGVHPLEVGHMVMAYVALKHLDVPAGLGDVHVRNGNVHADGPATIAKVVSEPGSVSFDLTLPFMPFFVPAAARPALALVPFQAELNRFRLDCSCWSGTKSLVVSIAGQEIATLRPSERAQSLDLASLDAAPWAQRGQMLWNLAQTRFTAHFQAWRELNVSASPGVHSVPDIARVAAPLHTLVQNLGRELRHLTTPATWRITVAESQALPIERVQVSPLYPFVPGNKASFAAVHPPETAPQSVSWTSAPLTDHRLDLGQFFNTGGGVPSNCLCYVRVMLEAKQPARVRLLLGSDDGISVFHQGKLILARNVFRGCRLGDDIVELSLTAGLNVVLLRVTQGGGGYAVAARVDLPDDVAVRVVD